MNLNYIYYYHFDISYTIQIKAPILSEVYVPFKDKLKMHSTYIPYKININIFIYVTLGILIFNTCT